MDAPLSQGQVILGKYRVERVLGRGAMGIVLAARHIQLDDRVAVKMLLPEMLAEPGVRERFLREAKAARRIKSEHVARVIDVGELEPGTPYIIMEYLEGKDLAKIRSERGALEIEEVVDYVIQACDAIAEAHSQGIIHRDLKPANLFLTRSPDGSPLIKVLDFGTSKMHTGGTDPSLEMTQTGMAIGSPSYMSPEQMLSSRAIDARADIWALGIILFNLLTGTFPFRAETLLQMCAAVIQSPPIPPSRHRADLPPELERVILKCLQKSPEDRFSDVAALARALLPFAAAEARYHVERIERVLGVASDLATFLAPSMRSSQISPLDVLPPEADCTSPVLGSVAQKEGVITSKSLSMTSLATVVKSGSEATHDAGLPGAGEKSRRTPILVALGAAICAAAVLFFALGRPHAREGGDGDDGSSLAAGDKLDDRSGQVRPLDTPTAIRSPLVVPPSEPVAAAPAEDPARPISVTPGRSLEPQPRGAGATANDTDTNAGAPLANAANAANAKTDKTENDKGALEPITQEDGGAQVDGGRPGGRSTSASNHLGDEKSPRRGRGAKGATRSPQPEPTATAREPEPTLIIPDDR